METSDNVISPNFHVNRGDVEEIDHRVANSLQLITSMLRLHMKDIQRTGEPIGRGECRIIIEEAACRIEAVATMHRLLSVTRDRASVELDQYLRTVSDSLVASLSFAGKVQATYQLSSGQLTSPDAAVSIALIITELLTNAIKYAHPTGIAGKIVVATSVRDGQLAIEVADDGVGLPVDHDPRTDGNLGLRLVRSMAAQYGGALEFESSEIGLHVQLLLPVANCRPKPVRRSAD